MEADEYRSRLERFERELVALRPSLLDQRDTDHGVEFDGGVLQRLSGKYQTTANGQTVESSAIVVVILLDGQPYFWSASDFRRRHEAALRASESKRAKP